MAKHEHSWEVAHEVIPPAVPVIDGGEDVGNIPDPDFEPPEGEVGYENDGKPYRKEYCACGETRIVSMDDSEVHNVAVRTGRIVEEVLTLSQEGRQSGV